MTWNKDYIKSTKSHNKRLLLSKYDKKCCQFLHIIKITKWHNGSWRSEQNL